MSKLLHLMLDNHVSRQETTTTNLADFGYREIKLARELFDAWVDQGLPRDFSHDGVHLMMNRNSGYVFLVNDEYQTAMMNGDKLESFYSCPECGKEGFADELEDQGNKCCTAYLKEIQS